MCTRKHTYTRHLLTISQLNHILWNDRVDHLSYISWILSRSLQWKGIQPLWKALKRKFSPWYERVSSLILCMVKELCPLVLAGCSGVRKARVTSDSSFIGTSSVYLGVFQTLDLSQMQIWQILLIFRTNIQTPWHSTIGSSGPEPSGPASRLHSSSQPDTIPRREQDSWLFGIHCFSTWKTLSSLMYVSRLRLIPGLTRVPLSMCPCRRLEY